MTSPEKLGITLVLLATGLAGIELFARLQYEPNPDAARGGMWLVRLAPIVRPSEDPDLYYEPIPEVNLRYKDTVIATDEDGFRIRVTPRSDAGRPAGEAVRLAVVGASMTFGFGVQARETYVEQVLPRLEQLWKRPVEMRNFSVPAYVSMQQARLFETAVLPWKPDLVLWHYDHRDASALLQESEQALLPTQVGDNLLNSIAWKMLARRLQTRRLHEMRYEDQPHEIVDGYIASGLFYDRHIEALRRVGRLATERRLPVVFVLFDAYLDIKSVEREHYSRLHPPLLNVLGDLGFHVLDLHDAILAAMKENDWPNTQAWWLSVETRDAHPNVDGHRFLADRVLEFVAANTALANLPP